uniref:UNC93-like protein MFSD11 n=1 Tax=Plectus sambesii TaxID=2011161 RepID=A0A914WYY2_9BILA
MDAQTWNVIQLGAAFMLIFAAFSTSNVIEETVMMSVANSTAGDIHNLSIIYAVFTFSNFLAPPIIGIIGAKWSMAIGASCYCLFMLGFLKLTGWFLYLSSGLVGLGGAILWTGQGNYLTLNSTNDTIGRNSGILWAMMRSCLIAGGIFLYFMMPSIKDIDTAKTKLLYTCFSAVCGMGILTLTLLRSPPQPTESENDLDALVESLSAEDQQVVDNFKDVNVKTTQAPGLTENFR